LPVAIVDFETTGVDPYGCRAVEMAIVHLHLGRGNIEVKFSRRFNPGVSIPEGASSVHGIYDADVQNELTFQECMSEIDAYLQGRVLSAYNLPYDWAVLNAEYRRSSVWRPNEEQRWRYGYQFFGICGLVMARAMDKGRRGKGYHKLGSVCERRGLCLEDAHTAEADAVMTAKLLEILLKEIAERVGRFPTVRDFWAWQRARAMEQERDFRYYLRSKGEENDVWPWTDY
jgi:DNA polymerase-3 subunit epsilon